MGEMLIPGLSDETLRQLKLRAAQRGQTPEQIARELLTESLRPDRRELLATADRIRAMTPKPLKTSSTEIIRADRDRR